MELIALNKFNHKAKVIRRKGIFKKIEKYIELDTRVLNDSNLGLFRLSYLNCPCKKNRKVGVEESCNPDGNLKQPQEFETYSVYRYINHLHSQIRLYGDDLHINILVEIIGLDNTIELLRYWVFRNIEVTERLKIAIERLSKQKSIEVLE